MIKLKINDMTDSRFNVDMLTLYDRKFNDIYPNIEYEAFIRGVYSMYVSYCDDRNIQSSPTGLVNFTSGILDSLTGIKNDFIRSYALTVINKIMICQEYHNSRKEFNKR